MDPMEKTLSRKTLTLGELVSYYYERFEQIYENEELRALAVSTVIDDLMTRPADEK